MIEKKNFSQLQLKVIWKCLKIRKNQKEMIWLLMMAMRILKVWQASRIFDFFNEFFFQKLP